jgi:hypothetical protein
MMEITFLLISLRVLTVDEGDHECEQAAENELAPRRNRLPRRVCAFSFSVSCIPESSDVRGLEQISQNRRIGRIGRRTDAKSKAITESRWDGVLPFCSRNQIPWQRSVR